MKFDKPVIILHGWSDKSVSFEPLAVFLREQGASVVDLWLGDYQSMRDRITIWDLGAAFKKALAANQISLDQHSFDCVIHSTGGLVVREFLRQVCGGDPSKTPVRNLVMLAPANFGSPLAKVGKSVIGRLFKGWDFDKFEDGSVGETGERILDALEMASPYSWQLGLSEIFEDSGEIFSPDNCRCTVMVGTNKYSGMRGVTHVPGGDGTVLVSTANLNSQYYLVDFSIPDAPTIASSKRRGTDIAFAVFNRNHGTITLPDDRTEKVEQIEEWQKIFLAGLSVTKSGYASHVKACTAHSQKTFEAGRGPNFNQYMNVVFRVRDQFGQPIPDYVIDFYQRENDDRDKVYQKIHGDVLEKVWTNSRDASYRSFLLDLTDLKKYLDKNPEATIEFSVGAAPVSREISYNNPTQPAKGIPVFSNKSKEFWHWNETVFVEIILYRMTTPDVFTLRNP